MNPCPPAAAPADNDPVPAAATTTKPGSSASAHPVSSAPAHRQRAELTRHPAKREARRVLGRERTIVPIGACRSVRADLRLLASFCRDVLYCDYELGSADTARFRYVSGSVRELVSEAHLVMKDGTQVSGYSSLRQARGSTGGGFDVRSSRKEWYGATNGSGAATVYVW
jgi:hypothetical protein